MRPQNASTVCGYTPKEPVKETNGWKRESEDSTTEVGQIIISTLPRPTELVR